MLKSLLLYQYLVYGKMTSKQPEAKKEKKLQYDIFPNVRQLHTYLDGRGEQRALYVQTLTSGKMNEG